MEPTNPKPRVASLTAREIAEGTGLALSTVYRSLHELEQRGLIIRTEGTQRPPDRTRTNV